jgi:hypothetical protein
MVAVAFVQAAICVLTAVAAVGCFLAAHRLHATTGSTAAPWAPPPRVAQGCEMQAVPSSHSPELL